MFKVDSVIKEKVYDGLSVQKIWNSDTAETLLITMDIGVEFPTHTSPRDALLVVLEGKIEFHIKDRFFNLERLNTFSFPANEPHHVLSRSQAKFLIIR